MKKRQINIELLRVVAMYMIVMLHALTNSGVLYQIEPLSLRNNIAWLLEAFCIVGVNCFFLISGYFYHEVTINRKKILHLWFEVEFYSVGIYALCCLYGLEKFGLKAFFLSLFPVLTKRYWFITVYIVLYLLSPYLKKLVESISVVEHRILVGILIFFFSLHPTFIPVSMTLDTTQGYGIIWAIVLYFTAAYVQRDRSLLSKLRREWYLFGFILISVLIMLSEIVIVKYNIASGLESRANFFAYNSITVFISSLFLFLYFATWQWNKKTGVGRLESVVLWFSRATLAVYLIHVHPNLYKSLWVILLHAEKWLNQSCFWFWLFGSCTIVFIICITIENLRIKAVEQISLFWRRR